MCIYMLISSVAHGLVIQFKVLVPLSYKLQPRGETVLI